MDMLDDMTQKRLSDVLCTITKHVHPVAVYLFGSRAEGRADQWSDYDLAVFIEGVEEWDVLDIVRFCGDIQKEAGDDIELHVFTAAQAENPEPASFASYILTHGIRLPLDELAA